MLQRTVSDCTVQPRALGAAPCLIIVNGPIRAGNRHGRNVQRSGIQRPCVNGDWPGHPPDRCATCLMCRPGEMLTARHSAIRARSATALPRMKPTHHGNHSQTSRGIPEGMSAVTVMAAGSPRQIMNEWTTNPEEILDTFISGEIKANMRHYSIWPGNYAIFVPHRNCATHFRRCGLVKG